MKFSTSAAALLACAAWGAPEERAVVVTAAPAGSIERNAAALLVERLRENGAVDAALASVLPQGGAGLTVLMDAPARAFLKEHGAADATAGDPGAEGFVIKSMRAGAGVVVAAAPVDARGAVYSVGAILRQVEAAGGGVAFPAGLDLRSAPAFRVRGTEVGQGATMRELTKARAWTKQEWRRALLDYVLAGANTFGGSGDDFAFLKGYGLTVHGGMNPNALAGHPEWTAVEPINRPDFVCPSIPAARKALLDEVEKRMLGSPPYDLFRIPSGDAGGCWCERCDPWGKTYILLCEDIAKIVHRRFPQARIYVTNQELSNAGDQFIFDYLNSQPRSWLAGIYYGPGSNAMSWNGTKRPDHRLDLFRFPGFGVYDGYLREMLNQLPRHQKIQLFTDATHWIASQYGFLVSDPMPDFEGRMPPPTDSWVYRLRPDPALLKVYHRRAFYARPRAYHRIFQETARYTEGDITYSEGHHDHCNQWIWQRLLWAPHTSLEDVLKEYTTTWFGAEAAPAMSEAILQLERNLTLPLDDNQGVERYYRLVREAGSRMPAARMAGNYLWREHMEKAALDRYIQLRLRRQSALRREVEARFRAARTPGEVDAAAAWSLARLKEPAESPEMARLREEAGRMGAESERLFGVRNTGYFNLDQDLAGLGWVEKQVRAAAAATTAAKTRLAKIIGSYDDPGEGGFYDDAGNSARSPHIVNGREYSVNNFIAGNVSTANLPSQQTMAYTDDSRQGVTLRYSGLDRAARYRARFAFVRPRYLPRFAMLHPQKTQSLYADGQLLAADVEVPEWEAELFEYDIPKRLTEDGELTLWLGKSKQAPDGPRPKVWQWKRTAGWGTIVSDVWLMKVADSERR